MWSTDSTNNKQPDYFLYYNHVYEYVDEYDYEHIYDHDSDEADDSVRAAWRAAAIVTHGAHRSVGARRKHVHKHVFELE